MTNYLWFFTVAMGPVLIAAVLAYALLRRRRLSAFEQRKSDEATRHLYESDERPLGQRETADRRNA